jgi:hypothetical protein
MFRRSVAAFSLAMVCAGFVSSLSAQAIPKPGEQFAAISKDAIYTWYGEPKAIYYEGAHKRTYMTWNSSTGTKGIGYYDHDTQDTMTLPLPPMPYGSDDHCHPAIIARPDGKLIIFCTGHDGNEVTELIAKNPEDISSWEAPIYPGGNGGYCYPNAVFLKAEGDSGRFYLFFRDSLLEPWFTTSDDWGKTWKPVMHLFHVSTYPNDAYKPYVKYASNDIDEIQMVIERQNRQGAAADKPIYFAKYRNDSFYQDNGRFICTKATLPLLDNVLDTIFYASRFGCSNTCYDVALDSNNNAVAVMDMFQDTGINIYWYMRWTGTSWFKTPFVNSGNYRGCQSGFAAGVTLDHENPNNVYLCRQMLTPTATPFNMADTSYTNYKNNLKVSCWKASAYPHELEKWTTHNGGATWDSLPITRNTANTYMNTNCLPCVPRHHKAGNKIEVMWLNGLYQSMSPTAINGYPGYQMQLRIFAFKDGELPSTAAAVQQVRKQAQSAMRVLKNGISVLLVNPVRSSLRFYSLQGKLAADCSGLVSRMGRGAAFVPFSTMANASGAYIVRLDNGQSITTDKVVIPY